MNTFKLERACVISKGLLPAIENILEFVTDSKSDISPDILRKKFKQLVFCDTEFQNKLIKLLNETRGRLQKEFDDM